MTDKNVIITLKDDNGKVVTFPVTPKEISLMFGNATASTVSILEMGEADYGKGKQLDGYKWSSFLPSRYDSSYCNCKPKAIEDYNSILNSWKNEATELRVVIPEISVNEAVKVIAYNGTYKGAELDFYYTIQLRQHVEIKCIKVAAKVVKVEEKRPAAPVGGAIHKGDKVHFNGGPVYYSSNAASPRVTRGAADCNVTAEYNGKHPIHLIHYSGDMVYGWCDPSNCTKL